MRNFLSIGNNTQTIDLSSGILTLVLGNNIDTNGGRNGAGKTSLIQGISYGLYGKPLTKIKLPNLCNNVNKKNMVVAVEFECDGTVYRIERGQKPAFMKFFVNGAEQKETDETQGENRKTQAHIETLLGMSHTMFRHVVALNTFTDPFLRMSVGDQRAVIEELLGVTQISVRAETLKKQIATTKERAKEEEAVIRTIIEANDRITKTITQTQRNSDQWEWSRSRTIADLAEQIEALRGIDFDVEIAAFEKLDQFVARERELNITIDAATADLERAEQGLVRERDLLKQARQIMVSNRSVGLQGDIDRKTKTRARHDLTVAKIEADLAAAKAELSGADGADCVCCGQPLTGTDHLTTVKTNLTAKVTNLEGELAREMQECAATEKEIVDLSSAYASAKSDEQFQEETKLAQIIVHERECEIIEEISVYQFRLAVEKAKASRELIGLKPVMTFATRDELYSAKQVFETLEREMATETAKTNPYIEQLGALRSTLGAANYESLNQLDTLLEHQEFLLKLLTSKDSFIRKRIIDQNISSLNSRMAYYLEKLGLPHSVQFQSDLSVEITLLGIDMDFEQLSRGEMNRVILGTSWAFRDVWESLNSPINLVLIDELVDNGTDSPGVDAAVEILKFMGRDRKKNVFLVSHRDELVSRIDTIMTVTKSDGFTTFSM